MFFTSTENSKTVYFDEVDLMSPFFSDLHWAFGLGTPLALQYITAFVPSNAYFS
jgi:hypothetical protein